MRATSDAVREEAIGWLLRLDEASPAEWETFIAWLEADEAHARAYKEMTALHRDLGPLLEKRARSIAAPAPTPVRAPARPQRRAFLGWAIAASLVAVVGYVGFSDDGAYTVETAAGERRTVELADGSRIVLNGSTLVRLDEDEPRFAALERGEALFSVVHDEAAPFVVKSGDAVLRDLGTEFNVVRNGAVLEVAVSDGAVLFNPDAEAVNLTPGMTLRQEGERIAVARGDAGSIGVWSENRLSYSDAPVGRIAEDLSRNLGVPVRVSAGAGAKRFSGVIKLDGGAARVMPRVAALLELEARQEGQGWLLTLESGASD